MDTTIAQAITSIAADWRASAATIADRAAEVLLRRATTGQPGTPAAFRVEMVQTGWELIRAQPAMAPIVNLVNAVLWRLEDAETSAELRQSVASATSEFRRQMRSHEGRVAEATLPLMAENARVLTISFSTTVRAALRHAQRAGRRLSVFCVETWPGYEGRDMFQDLVGNAVAAALVPDDEASKLIPNMDAVLVGADHLSASGLVNKKGTAELAAAAHLAGVPFYTLCGSEKFMPLGFVPPPHTLTITRNSRQQPQAYIDFTPLGLISGIVTEQGVLTSAAVEAWMAAIKLHPALVRE